VGAKPVKAENIHFRPFSANPFRLSACKYGVTDMTDNVIPLNMTTTQEIPVDRVLDGAKEKNLTRVLVIAETEEGRLYLAASHSDGPILLWDIEQAKATLFTMAGD